MLSFLAVRQSIPTEAPIRAIKRLVPSSKEALELARRASAFTDCLESFGFRSRINSRLNLSLFMNDAVESGLNLQSKGSLKSAGLGKKILALVKMSSALSTVVKRYKYS